MKKNYDIGNRTKMMKGILAVLTVSAMLAGCGNTAEMPQTDIAETETVTDSVDEQQTEKEEIANPWRECTEEEARENCARLFKLPEEDLVSGWSIMDEAADSDHYVGPLVQLDFRFEGYDYTARAQQGASETDDISGMYYDWNDEEDVVLELWGGIPAKIKYAEDEYESIKLITWYDTEIGIAYSLAVTGEDVDSFDILPVAEKMYSSDNDPMAGALEDFLQDQAGMAEFSDFDAAISYLKEGQGYAFIIAYESDEELLAVTDLVFEADSSAAEASIYAMKDGKTYFLGIVNGNGSAYPLRFEDGIIYGGDNHHYETTFTTGPDGLPNLMAKDTIDDGVDDGSGEFFGFTRQDNKSFDSEDFTGGQEEFDALAAAREEKPILKFVSVN